MEKGQMMIKRKGTWREEKKVHKGGKREGIGESVRWKEVKRLREWGEGQKRGPKVN